MSEDVLTNSVQLAGKISQRGILKYTPDGTPLYECTLAIPILEFNKKSVGYVPLLLYGEIALKGNQTIRVGKKIAISGKMWGRAYRNRFGKQLHETRIIVESIKEGGVNI